MVPRERSDSGTFVETVSLEDVLGVFDAVRGPVITSSDVADQLDCTTEAARQKLTRLYDQGKADKRKTGRTVVWWHTETSSTPTNSVEEQAGRETPSTPQPDQTPPPTSEPDTSDTTADLAGDLREFLEATDQPPKTDHGRGVILDVFQLLREQGTMSTGDLQDAIYPDYTEHWGGARTMWNAVDRYLADIPGVEKGGYGEWTYAGDESVREALDADPLAGDVYDPTEEY